MSYVFVIGLPPPLRSVTSLREHVTSGRGFPSLRGEHVRRSNPHDTSWALLTLERSRGSVGPSWHFLCVAREAFPHSRHAAVDGHPRCRNQHWRSYGKRDFPDTRKHLEGSPKGPRGGLGPLETPIWSRNGSPEGSQRGSGGVSEPSWFGVPS